MMIDGSIHPDDEITGNGPKFHERPFECPECGCHESRIIETLPTSNSIVRPRFCKNGHKFQTAEKVIPQSEWN